MFGLFKSDPLKKLKKEWEKKLESARNAQRNGKIELFGELSLEASEIEKKIIALESQQKS